MPRRLLSGLVALSLAGCASASPPVSETVPLPAMNGLGDPTRATVLSASAAFNEPTLLAGHPVQAARAAARLEWLAANLTSAPGWNAMSPLIGPALVAARHELRAALAVRAEARPSAVAAGLLAAAQALETGDDAAAARALGPIGLAGGAPVLAHLAALPRLPRTQFATSLARREMSLDGLYDID